MRALDIVIVNYRTPQLVRRLVESLSGWAAALDAGFLMVDSASGDESARFLAALEPAATVLCLEQNLGFGAAANRGAALGNAPWLLFLNPDVELGIDGLTRLFEAAAAGSAVLGGTCDGGPRAHGPLRARRAGGCIEVDWIAGSLMMLPRPDFKRVGGFDESYFMYMEDVDLCERLRARGVPSGLVPGVSYSHSGGASYAASGRDRAADWRASRKQYLSRRYGRAAGWVYDLFATAGGFMRRLRSRQSTMAGAVSTPIRAEALARSQRSSTPSQGE
ncbi:MAG: glycosyltransferase family 2 protein [Candidatus Wallbacteria bacterium]|nr:glycosyltransferase family 2 protein [Candidatus Wallbacteria bacterium]